MIMLPARENVSLKSLLALVVAHIALNAAQAAPPEWGADIGAGLAYSDNILRAPVKIDALLGTVDASAQLLKMTRSFMVDTEVAGVYRHFFDQEFGSDFLGQARLDSSWTPLPERFMWVLSDNFGQVTESAMFASSLLPVERQDVNVFSTGPVFAAPLPFDSRFELSGLYSDVYYQRTDLDNTRKTVRAAIEHEFSQRQAIYISASGSRRDYKSEVHPDFDLALAVAGLQAITRRSTIGIEGGVEELRGDAVERRKGGYIDVNIDRRLSARTSMFLRYVSRFADSADVFALDQTLEASLGDASNVTLTDEPIRQRRAGAGMRWEGARTSAHFSLSWSAEDIQSTALPDRDIYGVLFELNRRLSGRTNFGASIYYLREQRAETLTAPRSKQDDLAASLDLNIGLTEKLSLRGQFERYARLNSDVDEYSENRVLVTLRYIPRVVRRDLPTFVERRVGSRRGLDAEPNEGQSSGSGAERDRSRPRPPTP